MTATVTNNRNLTLPENGADSGVWGTELNNGVMSYLDNILGATQAITINSADVNLSITQWNNAVFNLTGTLTGNRSLVLPLNANSITVAVGGYFIVANNTSGAFTITVKTAASGSAGVTVAQGTAAFLYSDTTNVYNADSSKLQITPYAGNPNGFVAGTAASLNNPPSAVWDYTNAQIYFCTTTGNAAAAVWTLPVSPVPRGFDTAVNLSLSGTHTGGNLLSVAVKTQAGTDPTVLSPVIVNFQTRSSSNTTGAVATVNISGALSMTTFATGATMGSANLTPFRIWLSLFNNAGTAVLAMRNCSSANIIYPLAEYGVASTTPISSGATSAGVWYTPNGTTLTNCAFRLIGYVEYTSGLTTAGTYTSDPNNIVLFGPGIKKPGDLVQEVPLYTGAVSTGSTVIPGDDSVPQNTEGTQFMSQDITRTSLANILEVDWGAQLASSNGGTGAYVAAALFQDSIASALAVSFIVDPLSDNPVRITGEYSLGASTVSAPTFKIRGGSAASGTVTFNGVAGGRLYGGTSNSYLKIREIMG